MGAGKTAKMPGYIAWVYVYGLATQLAQADGVFNRWNEEEFRQTYYEKIVSGADPLIGDIEVEEQPLVQAIDEPDEPADTPTADEDEEGTEPAVDTSKVEPMTPKATRGRPVTRA